MGTKRQKKKAQKFQDKIQKWKDLKAGKIADTPGSWPVSVAHPHIWPRS